MASPLRLTKGLLGHLQFSLSPHAIRDVEGRIIGDDEYWGSALHGLRQIPSTLPVFTIRHWLGRDSRKLHLPPDWRATCPSTGQAPRLGGPTVRRLGLGQSLRQQTEPVGPSSVQSWQWKRLEEAGTDQPVDMGLSLGDSELVVRSIPVTARHENSLR